MRSSFLIFGSPRIEEPEIDEVVDSLRSGWLSTGPKVSRFETAFQQYTGAPYVAALNSCTAGLHLSLIVLGIGAGDEVITTPLTFAATANVIEHVGARPVFVDVDRTTMNIDPALIEAAITPRTKAIIPVHLAGRPCDMDAISAIARKHKLHVIEDAAHAIEAVYHGKKIGTISDLTVFSFYVTKNIVTGEGGMVTSASAELIEQIQRYGLHGLSKGAWKRYSDEGWKHYQVVVPGYKYNMMDLQAALGIHQLARIEEYHKRRAVLWERYNQAFAGLPIATPVDPEPDTTHAMHLYEVLIDEKETGMSRDAFQEALFKRNIGTGIHFISLHLHPYYRDRYHFAPDDFPNARYISERTLSLPFSAKLTDADADDVMEAVRSLVSES